MALSISQREEPLLGGLSQWQGMEREVGLPPKPSWEVPRSHLREAGRWHLTLELPPENSLGLQ